MGTDGALLCLTEAEHTGLDAPSVGVRLAASMPSSPASVLEPCICWLSGTGKSIGGLAGTLTLSLWYPTGRCIWVQQNECKLGLVHRWPATPKARVAYDLGSPFPTGRAVCACNSLAVQCPEASKLWDFPPNESLTPSHVAVQSSKVVAWRGPYGRPWQQSVKEVVSNVRRHEAKTKN